MKPGKTAYRLDYHGEGDDVPGWFDERVVRLMLEDVYGKAGSIDVLEALRWGRRVHVRSGVLLKPYGNPWHRAVNYAAIAR